MEEKEKPYFPPYLDFQFDENTIEDTQSRTMLIQAEAMRKAERWIFG